MEKRKIVIIGGNYSASIAMARSIATPDREITVLKTGKIYNDIKSKIKRKFIGKPIELTSNSINRLLYTNSNKEQAIIDILLKDCIDKDNKTILIPIGDLENSALDQNYDRLKDYFVFPNVSNKPREITRLMDKSLQKTTAQSYNLNVAKNYNVKLINGDYIIPNGIEYPVFLKPETSFLGKKTIMRKCNNKEELEEALNEIKETYKCPVLVEQFIDIEREYAALGYSYNNEVIIPGMIEMLSSGNGRHKGITLTGKVISMNKYKDLREKLISFIKSLNFNGLFDIDLVESKGKIYFVELNLRFGASGYSITKSGINLPNMYVNKICGITNESINTLNENTFISDKVNLEEFSEGNISWKEYKKAYENSDIRFIKSDSDPKPYKKFKRMEKYAYIKRLIVRSKKHV